SLGRTAMAQACPRMWTACSGGEFERALDYIERRYNDGRNYILHYVTAREAFDIGRAAAAGQNGDPSQFLDWAAPRYEADPERHPNPIEIDNEITRRTGP